MFEQVKQEIDDKIKTNGNNEITATRLNGVLQDMMDASAEVIEEVQRSIGDQVEANPTGEATTPLNKIKIGETIYKTDNPFVGEVQATDAERLQALANVSNQEAGYESGVFTGKMGYVVLQPQDDKDLEHTSFAAQIANKPNTIFEIRNVFDLDNVLESHDVELQNQYTFGNNLTVNYSESSIMINDDNYIILDENECLMYHPNGDSTKWARTYFASGTTVFQRKGEYKDITEFYIASRTDNSCIYKTISAIHLPKNSILKFNGGILKNAMIVGNDSGIMASSKIFENVIIAGSWICDGNIEWFAKGVNYEETSDSNFVDESDELQLALISSFSKLVFPPKYYYIGKTLVMTKSKDIYFEGGNSRIMLLNQYSDKQNIGGIFSLSNICLLRISPTTEQNSSSLSIIGGNFDVSKSSNYNSNCIEITSGYDVLISGITISSTIKGRYTEYGNLPQGNGIAIIRPDYSTNGYVTGININSYILAFGIGIYIPDSNYGWITDIVSNSSMNACAKAIKTSVGSITINGIFQSKAYFGENNKDSFPVIELDENISGENWYVINMEIWDLKVTRKVNNVDYYTNSKALAINSGVNSSVLLGDRFESKFYSSGYDYRNVISGNKDNIINYRTNNHYNKGLARGDEFNDFLVGIDGVEGVSVAVKLNGTEIDVPESINNMFRRDSAATEISLETQPSDNDYVDVVIDFGCSIHLNSSTIFLGSEENMPGSVTFITNGNYPQSIEEKIEYISSVYDNQMNVSKTVYFNKSLISTLTIRFKELTSSKIYILRLIADMIYSKNYNSHVRKIGRAYLDRTGFKVYGDAEFGGDVEFGGDAVFSKEIEVDGISLFSGDKRGDNKKNYINAIPTFIANTASTATPIFIRIDAVNGQTLRRNNYLIAICGMDGTKRIYSLYNIVLTGNRNNATTSGYECVIYKICGNLTASFELYANSVSPLSFLIKIITSTSYTYASQVQIINTDEDVSLVSGLPEGFTQVTSSDVLKSVNLSGDYSGRPSTDYAQPGYLYFNTSINKPMFSTGTKWIEGDGAAATVKRSGNSSSRPVGSNIYVGFMYFDTDISPARPIFASAISGDTVTWVDATGVVI